MEIKMLSGQTKVPRGRSKNGGQGWAPFQASSNAAKRGTEGNKNHRKQTRGVIAISKTGKLRNIDREEEE